MSYKIIEGLPKDVETEVSALLAIGWKRNGELFHRSVDGNNIAVQGMTQPEDDINVGIFTFIVTSNLQIDLNGLVNVFSFKQNKQNIRNFNYILKMRAKSEKGAREEILREFNIISQADDHAIQLDFLHRESYV